MSVSDKIKACVEGQPVPPATECFAVPGSNSVIDVVHPLTGVTVCFRKTLDECRAEKGYELAERMTIEEWCKQKAARQDTPVTWSLVTEEKYYEMLECLPPAYMGNGGFLVGEPWDHHAYTGKPRYAAYRERGGIYETASRPMAVKEFREVKL